MDKLNIILPYVYLNTWAKCRYLMLQLF